LVRISEVKAGSGQLSICQFGQFRKWGQILARNNNGQVPGVLGTRNLSV